MKRIFIFILLFCKVFIVYLDLIIVLNNGRLTMKKNIDHAVVLSMFPMMIPFEIKSNKFILKKVLFFYGIPDYLMVLILLLFELDSIQLIKEIFPMKVIDFELFNTSHSNRRKKTIKLN